MPLGERGSHIKERLEILTNTDQIIEEFKEKIKERQNQYEAEYP